MEIIVKLLLLLLWAGSGAYGAHLLVKKGYNARWLRTAAFYALPVITVLYFIFNAIQDNSTPWPTNLPGSLLNVTLTALLMGVSPAILIAAYVLPFYDKSDPAQAAVQRETISQKQGWLVFGGVVLISLILPLIAEQLFKEAPRYDSVISVIINGLLSGSLFALVALGYTLVYGIIELINFAHGDVFMMGSLVGYAVLTTLLGAKEGRPVSGSTSVFFVIFAVLLAIIIAMLVCGLLNYSINRIAYKRLRNAPRLAPLITAIGISFILQNIALYLNSSTPKSYPLLFPNSSRVSNVDLVSDIIGNNDTLITFPVTGFLVLIGAGILLLTLRYLINSTKIGKAMRAVAQNREAAALMGISIEGTISFAFLLGGALAGAAGVIYGIYQVQGTVRYDLGFVNGLFAFTAAVLGGIGNVNGAVLGGLFIGLIYSISQSSVFQLTFNYLNLSVWAAVSVFVILVLVMVFRPTGILGDNVQEKV
ncbi:branched-chain amino acid ABC transporter permease [Candidatus Chlorohelix sp.]|uniref:branched-chain amino acid ABC transporter permease n=1 Tax=Candidatus Chlorohelix sp. TaxID=3139201 RepID=UPI003024236B